MSVRQFVCINGGSMDEDEVFDHGTKYQARATRYVLVSDYQALERECRKFARMVARGPYGDEAQAWLTAHPAAGGGKETYTIHDSLKRQTEFLQKED